MKGFHIACLRNGWRSLSLSGGYIELEINVLKLTTHEKKPLHLFSNYRSIFMYTKNVQTVTKYNHDKQLCMIVIFGYMSVVKPYE